MKGLPFTVFAVFIDLKEMSFPCNDRSHYIFSHYSTKVTAKSGHHEWQSTLKSIKRFKSCISF